MYTIQQIIEEVQDAIIVTNTAQNNYSHHKQLEPMIIDESYKQSQIEDTLKKCECLEKDKIVLQKAFRKLIVCVSVHL